MEFLIILVLAILAIRLMGKKLLECRRCSKPVHLDESDITRLGLAIYERYYRKGVEEHRDLCVDEFISIVSDHMTTTSPHEEGCYLSVSADTDSSEVPIVVYHACKGKYIDIESLEPALQSLYTNLRCRLSDVDTYHIDTIPAMLAYNAR
jgi:hypothetical protein